MPSTSLQLSLEKPQSERLEPEENPYADENCTSVSGVLYMDVFKTINNVFPAEELEERTATSRADGYWPFLRKGQDPPKQYTYGEFDFYFFAEILDKACTFLDEKSNVVFTDLGSGTGRLVLAAAALHPKWKLCRGVEVLEAIHALASENVPSHLEDGDEIAAIEMICGSFTSPYTYFGDSNLIFCFSSCLGSEILTGLAENIARTCRPGTIVVTTDLPLPLEGECLQLENGDEQVPSGPYRFSVLEILDGYCWLTGGTSTAYLHRLETSCWNKENPGPWEEPYPSAHEMAYAAYKTMESHDPEPFLTGVHNSIVFSGLPEQFSPRSRRSNELDVPN